MSSSPTVVAACSFLMLAGIALIGRFDDVWTLWIGAAVYGVGMGIFGHIMSRPEL